ncbi:MAG: hypothetical protein QM706_08155 [Nitrospira sp.]
MLIEQALLERRQVEAYTALIREIGDKDVVTRQPLVDILSKRRHMRASVPIFSNTPATSADLAG